MNNRWWEDKFRKYEHRTIIDLVEDFRITLGIKRGSFNYLNVPILSKLYNGLKPHKLFSNVEIETSSECNFKCQYCPVSTHPRPKGIMPAETIAKAIVELKELKYEGTVAPHFYNEPLLDERLPQIIELFHKQLPKASILLVTNGSKLTYETFKELVNRGVVRFKISQYGPKILPNIKKLFNQLSVEEREYIRYTNHAKEGILLSNRGGLVKVKKALKLAYCYAPTNTLTIDYLGNVHLCCNDYLGQHNQGNINNEKIIDIWNKPNFKQIRKELRKGDFSLPLCKKCTGTTK